MTARDVVGEEDGDWSGQENDSESEQEEESDSECEDDELDWGTSRGGTVTLRAEKRDVRDVDVDEGRYKAVKMENLERWNDDAEPKKQKEKEKET